MWVQNSVVMDDESVLRDVPDDVVCRLHGEGEVITAGAEMELGQTWNQIARCGDFRGHKHPFSITRRTMEEMIQNFRETRNQHVQVDYEHASEQDPALLGDGGAPAVAWVRDLSIRDGSEGPTLWALFDWVDPDAVQKVRSRRYKYLSPSLTMRSRHPETGVELGAKLWSVGLVNRPFIDGMAPVTASDSPERKFKPTAGMVAAFRRGLALHEEGHSGDGLKPETVAWARRIVDGESITRDKLVDMAAWFARHDTPDERAARKREEPSPALVAWLLWGGDPGRTWSAKKRAQLEKIEAAEREAMAPDTDNPTLECSDSASDWDGSAAEAALRKWAGGPDAESIDWAKYARGFAWHDAAAPKSFGSYKLPFMDVEDGKLVPNQRGISSALAALNGARGGVDIPEAGKAEARKVLESHQIRENSAVSFAATPADSNTAEIPLDGNSAEGRFVPMDSAPSATPATAALTPGDVHVPTPEPKHNCANKFAKAMCSALSAAPFNCAITLSDGADYEAAEADMIGKLQGLASEMGRLQQAEMKSLRAEAAALVTLAAKSGAFVIDDGQDGDAAIETAVQLCLSDRKVFDGLYGARIAKFTAAKADAPEQYRVLASFRKPDVSNAAEVRRLLSQQIVAPASDDEIKARSAATPDPAAKSLASDRPGSDERNSRVFVRAQELATANKVPLETAIRMAEHELPTVSR